MTIKLPPANKLVNKILANPSTGFVTELAKFIMQKDDHYSTFSDDEINEHIERNEEALENLICNHKDLNITFCILNEEPLKITIYKNNIYAYAEKLCDLDGKKFEDLVKNLFIALGFKDITPHNNGKDEDALCVDIDARYNHHFINGYIFAQIKWKKDSNAQINLSDLRNFVGGISCICHEYYSKDEKCGKYFTKSLLYITSATFHDDAKKYAKLMGINCIDGAELVKIIFKNKLATLFYKKYFIK